MDHHSPSPSIAYDPELLAIAEEREAAGDHASAEQFRKAAERTNDGRGTEAFQRSKEMSAKVNKTKPPKRSPELWKHLRAPLLARGRAVRTAPRPVVAVAAPRESHVQRPRERREGASSSTSSSDPGDEPPPQPPLCVRCGESPVHRESGERQCCVECWVESFITRDEPEGTTDPAIVESEPDDDGRMLTAQSFATVKTERTRWLWDGRIPLGTATLLVGREKLGKSTLTVELAAQLSRGTLAGDLRGQPSDALLITFEDSTSRTVKPRLMAAGADLSRVHTVGANTDGVRDLVSATNRLLRRHARRAVPSLPTSGALAKTPCARGARRSGSWHDFP